MLLRFISATFLIFTFCKFSMALEQYGERQNQDTEQQDKEQNLGEDSTSSTSIIKEIRIKGLERVSQEYVLSVIFTQVGEQIDSIKIRKDIERLFKLDFFEDINVVFEDGILEFRFKEKPIISDVKIEGRDELEEETLKNAIFLKKGDFFDEQKVLNQIEKIKEQYVKEGFILVEIVPEVQRIERENRVNLTLRIKEGEKFSVRKILVSGSEALGEEDIKKEFESKEKSILRDIGGESKFDMLKVQKDTSKLKLIYLDNGFLDIASENPVVLFNPLKREAILIYKVSEGIRYKIKSIDLLGDILFPKDQIFDNLKTKQGEFFSRKKVLEDIDWISSLYQDVGFAQTVVVPSVSKSSEPGFASVDFKIEKSSMYYVRRINITGNSRTRDFVIRREISLLEGEVFGRTPLFDSYLRLMRSGYFENIEINPFFLQENSVDVNVNVKEGRIGAISLGGGFSPQAGNISQSLFLMFQGNIANFRGLGQNLGFYVLFGGGIAFFNFYLRDEHIFDTDYIGGLNLFSYQSVFLPFIKRTLGAKPNFGLFLSRRTKVIMYPGFEIIDVYDRSGNRIPLYQGDVGAGFLRSNSSFLRIELINDSRDNVLAPTKGRYITLWSKVGGAFGGDVYFVKLGSITSFYIPTGIFGTVFSHSFRFGVGFGLTSSRFLPYPERFFAGGIYTIRGFDYFTLGPRQSYEQNNSIRTIILGGNKMFISNIELVLPVSKQVGIFMVPFVDIGQVFKEQEFINPLDFRISTGIELRWISPFGPLRFSFGVPVIKKKGDQVRFFDFSLGLFTFYPEFEEY